MNEEHILGSPMLVCRVLPTGVSNLRDRESLLRPRKPAAIINLDDTVIPIVIIPAAIMIPIIISWTCLRLVIHPIAFATSG